MGSSNENSAYGPVRNPRALDRVPGGSSGGSAAAVAAGFCVASLGTDTGGSIRQPAAFCGVVGVLPTYGRVSRYGLIAFASSLDRVGPFTTHGGGCGDDAGGAGRARMRWMRRARTGRLADYVGGAGEAGGGAADRGAGGVLRRGAGPGDSGGGGAGARRAAGGGMRSVKPVRLPHTRYAIPTYYVMATAEASSNLSRFDGVRFGLRAEEAKTLSAMYRKTREEGFGAEVKRRILLGTYALERGLLRRVLPQGAAGADAADAGLSGGVRARWTRSWGR